MIGSRLRALRSPLRMTGTGLPVVGEPQRVIRQPLRTIGSALPAIR